MPPQPLHQHPRIHIPDPHHRIQTPRSDQLAIRRDGDRSDSGVVVMRIGVVDGEDFGCTVFHVPDTSGFVARAGDDEAAVGGEVEGVDFLLVAVEDVADALFGDVPDLQQERLVAAVPGYGIVTYPNLLILSTGSQIFAIGTETYTPDIQIPRFSGSFVH